MFKYLHRKIFILILLVFSSCKPQEGNKILNSGSTSKASNSNKYVSYIRNINLANIAKLEKNKQAREETKLEEGLLTLTTILQNYNSKQISYLYELSSTKNISQDKKSSFSKAVLNKDASKSKIVLNNILEKRFSAVGVELDYAWKKNKFHLCYSYDEGYYDNGMDSLFTATTKVIKKEFSIEKNGVEFYGFDDCKNATNIDLKFVFPLYITDDKNSFGGYVTHVGNTSHTDDYQKKHYFKNIKTNYPIVAVALRNKIHNYGYHNDFILSNVLHETTHFLGMRHSTEHPDSTCKLGDINYKIDNVRASGRSISTYDTASDPKSIMSYCVQNIIDLKGLESSTTVKSDDAQLDVSSISSIAKLSKGDDEFLLNLYINKKKSMKHNSFELVFI